MRVCLVAPELLPVPPIRGGAIEAWIDAVAPHLARRGVEVHIISVGDVGLSSTSQTIGSGRVTSHYLDLPRALSRFPLTAIARGAVYFRRVGRLIERLQPDIVHHHNRPLGLLIAKNRYAHPCRHVLSIHNIDYGWCLSSRRIDRLFFAKGFARCDRILPVSDFLGSYLARRVPSVDPQRMHTLHNGVDPQVFSPNGAARHRESFGLSQGPLILFAGRIDPRKGVHVLLEVFRQVARELPAAQLVIVGPKGSYWHRRPMPYARQIQEQADRMAGVQVLDPIYDRARLAQLYASADVACLPFCSEEAFGLTTIELQACGVPVVTTTIGGGPETVLDGHTGFLVAPHDAQAMAEKVLLLLRDQPLREGMRREARAFIEARFSWQALADRLLRQYEAALASTPAAPSHIS